MSKLRIAVMGIRGIPANYGGFETFAEELSTRLAQRGHEVTVYGRSNNVKYPDKFYRGVRLVVLPTIRHKYFDTVAHTFLCVMHSLTQNYDVILVCNSANAIFSWIPRLKRIPVAMNVDGLEWKRAKWNFLGKAFYRLSEWLGTFCVNEVVTDARDIEQYYLNRYNKRSTYIPYGAPVGRVETAEVLQRFNLQPKQYVLYVSRFEPENNPHHVVRAFEQVRTDLKLVMVGDAPYSTEFIQKLKSTRDPRIVFTGYVFGQGYRELQSNAYLYIQGTEVGGTHPALLEGMGHGNCVLANDVPEHREVLGEAGYFFTIGHNGDLRDKMQYLLDNPQVAQMAGQNAMARIQERYTWDRITDSYEQLLLRMARKRRSEFSRRQSGEMS